MARAGRAIEGHRVGDSSRRLDQVRRDLLQRTGRQCRDDPILDLPERIANAALRILSAVLRLGRTGGHGQRSVDRLDDVGDRDLRHRPRQPIAAARSLVRGEQPAPREALQHLRHQFDRDVVLLGDLARTRRRRRPAASPGASSPSVRSRLFSRVAAYRALSSCPADSFPYHIPSCSFAAGDIRSFVHVGSQTISIFASVTPGTALTLFATSTGSDLRDRASGRGQRHPDPGDTVCVHQDVVNQPELPDVHRDLGVEHGRYRLDDRRLQFRGLLRDPPPAQQCSGSARVRRGAAPG